MIFTTENLPSRDIYRMMVSLIAPRPIAWVSTRDRGGRSNLAPYSFFNGVGSNPPCLVFAPANRSDGMKKDTLLNIEQSNEFVVNLVSHSQSESMNQTAAEYPQDVSEFEACGVESTPSVHIDVPRVSGAVASFECEAMQILHLGEGPGGANLVIGRILAIHIQDELVDDQGFPLAEQLDLIGRLGGSSYVRVSDRFDLKRPKL
ncbi:MAG: flavin reductase family protein [Planctomycetota bacterium]|nr:flavin reductase family protein [Planctomycetota bacterium]